MMQSNESIKISPAIKPIISEIRYRDEMGDFSIYDFWMNGRVILEIAVDKTDPDLVIWVGKVDTDWAAQPMSADDVIKTNGHAQLIHDASRIFGGSVKSYINYRRALRFISELYIPHN